MGEEITNSVTIELGEMCSQIREDILQTAEENIIASTSAYHSAFTEDNRNSYIQQN